MKYFVLVVIAGITLSINAQIYKGELKEYQIESTAFEKEPSSKKSDFFFVKTNRKIVKVEYQNILFVESFGEYVKIYTTDDILLALQTTSFMEKTLPADDFVRIHRSHIINLNHVKEIVGNEVSIDQHRLVISKRMKEQFMNAIRERGII